ncbi:preprotein translocase subunit YajC [Fibrella aquatilis]|uniref:Sec translocon accessory complex subunit YajC n=1 Tax=Fibrella aquatilis TaxID=2817059 RepID=A0A939JUD1_9BACT|nr:preprotein translocase subunit YajC [Fibrella aquatilis]MBO0929662.1 preprotein translocase subunit YajC [Fibrella aquatilis]
MHVVIAQAMGQNGMLTLLLWGGVLLVLYFFMIRPQQQKAKQQKDFVNNLKKGDAVVTIGGLYGKITSVDANTVTLDVDRGVKLTFDKSSIAREASAKVESEKAA